MVKPMQYIKKKKKILKQQAVRTERKRAYKRTWCSRMKVLSGRLEGRGEKCEKCILMWKKIKMIPQCVHWPSKEMCSLLTKL